MMRLSGSATSLTVAKIDSLNELEERLARAGGKLIVGADAESPRYFFFVTLGNGSSFGLVSPGGELSTGITGNGKSLVAYCGRIIFALSDDKMNWKAECPGTIYEVAVEKDHIDVVHELGALRFSDKGQKIRSVVTDVVIDYNLTGDTVTITSDSGTCKYNLNGDEPEYVS